MPMQWWKRWIEATKHALLISTPSIHMTQQCPSSLRRSIVKLWCSHGEAQMNVSRKDEITYRLPKGSCSLHIARPFPRRLFARLTHTPHPAHSPPSRTPKYAAGTARISHSPSSPDSASRSSPAPSPHTVGTARPSCPPSAPQPWPSSTPDHYSPPASTRPDIPRSDTPSGALSAARSSAPIAHPLHSPVHAPRWRSDGRRPGRGPDRARLQCRRPRRGGGLRTGSS